MKRYEHFHQKSSAGQNDARLSLVTVLHTGSLTMIKYITIQNLNQIIQAVQEYEHFH